MVLADARKCSMADARKCSTASNGVAAAAASNGVSRDDNTLLLRHSVPALS